MVCLNHPDKEAAAVCAACGKPLCNECILSTGDGSFCSQECIRRGQESRQRSAQVIATSARTDRKLRKKGFIWFIILLLLAAGAWFFYQKNQKTVDRKFNSVARSIKDGANEAINAGKGAMPQDSKYKRKRESLVK